jgi:hypothetical protein
MRDRGFSARNWCNLNTAAAAFEISAGVIIGVFLVGKPMIIAVWRRATHPLVG